MQGLGKVFDRQSISVDGIETAKRKKSYQKARSIKRRDNIVKKQTITQAKKVLDESPLCSLPLPFCACCILLPCSLQVIHQEQHPGCIDLDVQHAKNANFHCTTFQSAGTMPT